VESSDAHGIPQAAACQIARGARPEVPHTEDGTSPPANQRLKIRPRIAAPFCPEQNVRKPNAPITENIFVILEALGRSREPDALGLTRLRDLLRDPQGACPSEHAERELKRG
jgi:hypothetical protein